MTGLNPLRIVLFAINVALVVTCAAFASTILPLPVAIAMAFALLGIEGLIWRRLTSEPSNPPMQLRGPERISELINRRDTRKHAIREETTGLYNRWYLEMRVEQEALRCDRYSHSMAVIVISAGAINLSEFSADSWQNQSAQAAERCLRVVRNIDLSAFLAPLEFAICLIQCDRTGAEHALNRLRNELSEYSLDAGVAVYPEDGCEPLALIDLARVRSRREAASQGHALDGLPMASGQ
jgi:GGDEF domain-containing protein